MMRVRNWLNGPVPGWIWVTLLILLVLLAGGLLTYRYWGWLTFPLESGSTTIRNIGLILAGLVALILALWRGAIGERQATAAEQTVSDGRYQRGVEMLASDNLSARLGGIYSLRNLAESQPEQYHIQVMRMFCAFVRHPPPYDSEEAEKASGRAEAEANPRKHVHGRPRARADVQAVMDAIGLRSEAGIDIEKRAGFTIDLNGADLSWTYLEKTDLSNADLTFANLSHAVFYEWRHGSPPPRSSFAQFARKFNPDKEPPLPSVYANEKGWRQTYTANLSGADLSYANLTAARMEHVNLSGAQIREATLNGVRLGFAYLRGANLFEADLSSRKWLYTGLSGADLTDASLRGSKCVGVEMRAAVLHGTWFSGAELWATSMSSANLTDNGQHPPIGLTQEMLDQTFAPMEGNRPDLKGVMDAVTGKQLVWRDAIPHDDKLRHAGLWDPEDDEYDEGGEYSEEKEENEPPTASYS